MIRTKDINGCKSVAQHLAVTAAPCPRGRVCGLSGVLAFLTVEEQLGWIAE